MHTVSAIIGHGSDARIPNTADLKRRAQEALAVSGLSGITVLEPKREALTACSTSVEISFIKPDGMSCDVAAMTAIRRAFKAAVGLALADSALSMNSSGGDNR